MKIKKALEIIKRTKKSINHISLGQFLDSYIKDGEFVLFENQFGLIETIKNDLA